jgi:5-methylcytosine-specific restriction endonuclease McrA
MSRGRQYRQHHHGRVYQRARAQMFATRGTVCVHCGHDGAGEADYIVPLSVDPEQPIDPDGLQPAHGANYPCPTCGRKCNTERGGRLDYQQHRPTLDW